ncbi:MAG: DUF3268 family zinc-finger domain-containing protein [Clostridiales Family XIII bacterium]|jgi:hypothetical protein|nr:DUF3268 family zinc-finger domain-containing protein [Clostridiales Family XIII bacterium]
MKVVCPYCGRAAEYTDSKTVYGRSYGMIYLCRDCDAYVGVHKGTDKPLGRLANRELRRWKNAAHAAFDELWRFGSFTRREAYAWLSRQLGIPIKKTHIGMFDIAECKKVITAATDFKEGLKPC